MQAARVCEHRQRDSELGATHHGLNGGFQVLLDTFTVEDVSALRLDSILGELVAKSANSTFPSLILDEHAGVVLAAKNKVRMARHLTHTGEPKGGCKHHEKVNSSGRADKLKMLE